MRSITAVVACQVVVAVLGVEGAEGLEHVGRDDAGIGGRVPDVWLRAVVGMAVFGGVRFLFGQSVGEDEIDAVRGIEDLQVRGVVRQAVHPRLFEADEADAQVGRTLRERHQLGGRGVVSLGAAPFGHHADHVEAVAGDGFGEVAQGFDADGDDRLVVRGVRLLFSSRFAGGEQEDEHPYRMYSLHFSVKIFWKRTKIVKGESINK